MTQVPPPYPAQPVVITRIAIPFTNLVGFFVKAALAAIPAGIILWLIGMAFWMVLGFLFTGMWGWPMRHMAL